MKITNDVKFKNVIFYIRDSTTAGGNTVAVTWSACAQDAFVMAALHARGNVAALELM